eukprot:TRINITY_DN7569_c0_g1_i1.p1 TRINITY_DN7569_c0_g1~~TRINITY_DN7569_c0_g1_i1.p1  ORF type:complete len:726 (-),score=121.00 TRINITY_DN7569_c0_g1_i1:19-2196(-)
MAMPPPPPLRFLAPSPPLPLSRFLFMFLCIYLLFLLPLVSRGQTMEWVNEGVGVEENWHGSPLLVEVEGGRFDVFTGAYGLRRIDGRDGATEWELPSSVCDISDTDCPSGLRSFSSIAAADIDGDGVDEIVSGLRDGLVAVSTIDGVQFPGFPAQVTSENEVRALLTLDIDGDGKYEVMAATTNYVFRTHMLEEGGEVVWEGMYEEDFVNYETSGRNDGLFHDATCAGVLAGELSVFVGSFTTINGRSALNGDLLPVDTRGTDQLTWSSFRLYPNNAEESQGYGSGVIGHVDSCVVADVDQDSTNEVVLSVVFKQSNETGSFSTGHFPLILNADRTRFTSVSGDSWADLPWIPGKESFPELFEPTYSHIAPVDLDGDGILELVWSSYDGGIYAVSLDQQPFGSFPYFPTEGSYACGFAVIDIEGDGFAELIVGSGTEPFEVTVLDYLGVPILQNGEEVVTYDLFGVRAPPSIGNIDDDDALEMVWASGHKIVALEIEGTSWKSKILWGTAKGNFQRTGQPPPSACLTPRPSENSICVNGKWQSGSVDVGDGGEVFETDITINGDVNVTSSDLVFGGGVTVNGDVNVDSSSSISFVLNGPTLNGNVTIDGSTIITTDSSGAPTPITVSGCLTLSSDVELHVAPSTLENPGEVEILKSEIGCYNGEFSEVKVINDECDAPPSLSPGVEQRQKSIFVVFSLSEECPAWRLRPLMAGWAMLSLVLWIVI